MKHSGRFVSKVGIEKQGIDKARIVHWNDCAATLYQMAVARDEGMIAEGGPLVVRTGTHTGRSAQDKFTVRDATTEKNVWWDNNKSMTPEHFAALHKDMLAYTEDRELWVQDLFCSSFPTTSRRPNMAASKCPASRARTSR